MFTSLGSPGHARRKTGSIQFSKELKWRLGCKIKWKRENHGTGKATFWAFLPDVLLELKGLREAKAFVSLKIRKQIY